MILVYYLIFFLIIKYILVGRIPTAQKCVKYTFHLKSHTTSSHQTLGLLQGVWEHISSMYMEMFSN